MKIHISETTKEILDEIGGFKLEKRGEIEIKVRILAQALHKFISLFILTGQRNHGNILVEWARFARQTKTITTSKRRDFLIVCDIRTGIFANYMKIKKLFRKYINLMVCSA